MKTLILGGVRSGKSRLAERYARTSGLAVCYIATATAEDDAMQQRITSHQRHRPKHWKVIEEPLHLAAVLKAQANSETCLLVDCLTLWLTNLLLTENDMFIKNEQESLLAILPVLPGNIIFVSNETNMGVMPLGELSRRYCDEAGRLHQQLAQICDQVILTVAGLPHTLKGKTT